MSQRSDHDLASHEEVSALMDGELDASAVARACAHWRDEADARASWHTWHLIGDVLRSDDLASAPSHDSAFMTSLRERLAAEPVVLAPQAATQVAVAEQAVAANGTIGRRAWRAPVAVAAGFAVVASVLVLTSLPSPSPFGGGVIASNPSAAGATVATAQVAPRTEARAGNAGADAQVVLDGKLIRDARIDDYLAAHKKFGGSSGPGGPSGYLRNAAAEGR